MTYQKQHPTSGSMRTDTLTVHVQVKKNAVVEGHADGAKFWTTPHRAQEYKKMGVIDIIGGVLLSAAQQAVLEKDAMLGKSSGARSTGPSTDTASSNPNGAAAQSSAAVEAQASPPTLQPPSTQPVKPTSAESSSSTTATSASATQTSPTSRTTSGGRGTRIDPNFRRGRR